MNKVNYDLKLRNIISRYYLRDNINFFFRERSAILTVNDWICGPIGLVDEHSDRIEVMLGR